MKLTIILTSNSPETNWNALRLANFSLKKGDEVSVFLLGEGVEYEQKSSDRFNIKQQLDTFMQSEKSHILACESCMKLRHQPGTETCPIGGMAELYNLISTCDKVVTF